MKKFTAVVACLTLFLQLVTACLPFAALADDTGADNTLYVAVNGNDAWSGTVDKPLRTLEAARKLIEREGIKNAAVTPLIIGKPNT